MRVALALVLSFALLSFPASAITTKTIQIGSVAAAVTGYFGAVTCSALYRSFRQSPYTNGVTCGQDSLYARCCLAPISDTTCTSPANHNPILCTNATVAKCEYQDNVFSNPSVSYTQEAATAQAITMGFGITLLVIGSIGIVGATWPLLKCSSKPTITTVASETAPPSATTEPTPRPPDVPLEHDFN